MLFIPSQYQSELQSKTTAHISVTMMARLDNSFYGISVINTVISAETQLLLKSTNHMKGLTVELRDGF